MVSGSIERYRGVKGLYVLLIDLNGGWYRVGRLFEGDLPGGLYVYIGSAWGPGGLGGRVARHIRRGKMRHWHIDWITSDERARVIIVYLFPGLRGEDRLYRALEPIGECVVPGFGSSDTRGSRCHFLRLRANVDSLEDVLRGFYPYYIKIPI